MSLPNGFQYLLVYEPLLVPLHIVIVTKNIVPQIQLKLQLYFWE